LLVGLVRYDLLVVVPFLLLGNTERMGLRRSSSSGLDAGLGLSRGVLSSGDPSGLGRGGREPIRCSGVQQTRRAEPLE
jgi:hypothetical protein